jgi:hypothetical protein
MNQTRAGRDLWRYNMPINHFNPKAQNYSLDEHCEYTGVVHLSYTQSLKCLCFRMWVPVTTAWRVLRLRMEERPPVWRVAVNKLNKQPRTADEGWSSSLGGLGEVLTTPLRKKRLLRITHVEMLPLETKQSGDKFGSPEGSVSRGSITQP